MTYPVTPGSLANDKQYPQVKFCMFVNDWEIRKCENDPNGWSYKYPEFDSQFSDLLTAVISEGTSSVYFAHPFLEVLRKIDINPREVQINDEFLLSLGKDITITCKKPPNSRNRFTGRWYFDDNKLAFVAGINSGILYPLDETAMVIKLVAFEEESWNGKGIQIKVSKTSMFGRPFTNIDVNGRRLLPYNIYTDEDVLRVLAVLRYIDFNETNDNKRRLLELLQPIFTLSAEASVRIEFQSLDKFIVHINSDPNSTKEYVAEISIDTMSLGAYTIKFFEHFTIPGSRESARRVSEPFAQFYLETEPLSEFQNKDIGAIKSVKTWFKILNEKTFCYETKKIVFKLDEIVTVGWDPYFDFYINDNNCRDYPTTLVKLK